MAKKKGYIEQHSIQVFVFCNDEILMVEENVYGTKRFTVPKRMVKDEYTDIENAKSVVNWETGVMLNENEFIQEMEAYDVCYSDGTNQNYKKKIKCLLFFTKRKSTTRPASKGVFNAKYMQIADFLKICSFQNVSKLTLECVKILNEKQLTNIVLAGDCVEPDIYCDIVRNDLQDTIIKEINEVDRCILSNEKYNEDLIKDVFDFFENLDLEKLGSMSDGKMLEIINVCTGGMHSLLVGNNLKRIFNISPSPTTLYNSLITLIVQERAKPEFINTLSSRCFVYLLVAIGAKKGLLTARRIERDFQSFYAYSAVQFKPYSSIRPIVTYDYLCSIYPELEETYYTNGLTVAIDFENVFELAFKRDLDSGA